MRILCIALVCFMLSGCGGVYIGLDGVRYSPDPITGFRTIEYDDAVEVDRKKAFKAGESSVALPDAADLPDSSIVIFDSDDVSEATGGAMKYLAPFIPAGGGLLLLLISHFITRRKKNGLT